MEDKIGTSVTFTIPVINGQIYLGQRGTEPFQGYYGAIGEKVEKGLSHPFNQRLYKETLGGHLVPSAITRNAELLGEEQPIGSAIRGLCEEVFSDKKFPEDFSEGDFSHPAALGVIVDNYKSKKQHCHFILLTVNRDDFHLSQRELQSFKPLQDLTLEDKLFPLTKLALLQVAWSAESRHWFYLQDHEHYNGMNLGAQIPDIALTIEEARFTSMIGPVMRYHEQGWIY
ncbi:MAG: hypothetical protein ABIJ18_04325 [archaeon]